MHSWWPPADSLCRWGPEEAAKLQVTLHLLRFEKPSPTLSPDLGEGGGQLSSLRLLSLGQAGAGGRVELSQAPLLKPLLRTAGSCH